MTDYQRLRLWYDTYMKHKFLVHGTSVNGESTSSGWITRKELREIPVYRRKILDGPKMKEH